MFLLLITILAVSTHAIILPPGFVVRSFAHTRDKVTTMKVEQKVSYDDGLNFKETFWYKSPGKIRVVLDDGTDSLTFIRSGNDCVVVSAGKRIKLGSCPTIATNFYYNLLAPYGNLTEYVKRLKIDPREGMVTIKKNDDGTYINPEGIYLARLDKKPVYIVGVTEGVYKSSCSDGSDSILLNIKEKTPQMWIDAKNFYPLRIFGEENGAKVEINMGSYISDGNEVPFPHAIELMNNGISKVNYNVNTFETELTLNDELFDVAGTRKKNVGVLDEQSMGAGKKKLVEYIKEFR